MPSKIKTEIFLKVTYASSNMQMLEVFIQFPNNVQKVTIIKNL